MAGLYIHIPYCSQKCSYCDFHFSTSLKSKNEMLLALKKEITLRKEEIQEPIKTIYFGGGTPSVLSVKELKEILFHIEDLFDTSLMEEITLEANPENLTLEYLNQLKNSAISRLSIGIQSFIEKELQLMKRIHSSQEALSCIQNAQDLGFENITIDLIYGINNSSEENFQKNLETIKKLSIPHLSAYALTVEKGTELAHKIKTGELPNIEEDKQFRDFVSLQEFTKKEGFEQYEISNFAKKGFRSKHNSSYWKSEKYLGIGPSAHSFDGKSRSWNIANNPLYIKNIMADTLPSENETLSENDLLNEKLMISLRTLEGLPKNEFLENLSATKTESFLKALEKLKKQDLLIEENHWIKIPENNRFLSDGIASSLFFI